MFIPHVFSLLLLGTHLLVLPETTTSAMGFANNSAIAQANRNSISGMITDTGGQGLNRIRVELQDDVEMTITQTFTDSTGRYTFRNLTTGTFNVKVHSDGKYAGRSVRVSLYSARAGGGAHQEQLDIVLKSLSEIRNTNAPANAGITFAQDVPDNARKMYDRAVKQLDAKQIDTGIISLKEAIGLFPTYFVALERLGVEHMRRQEYEPASDILDRAVKVNPNGAASQYALGVSLFYQRRLGEAAESLRKSLALTPNSPNAAFSNFYLGLALWRLKKPGEAEPYLKKACELGGSSMPPDVHLHLAKHYSDTTRFRDAADELELFLKLAPDARDADNIRELIRRLRTRTQSGSNFAPIS
ncbi:MAG: tetratricopeptide repeat protein [Blastocatellia bacterium]